MRHLLYRVAPVLCLLALAAAVAVQWTANARALPGRAPAPAAERGREDDRLLTVGEYRRLEEQARLRDIQEQQDWLAMRDHYRAQQLRGLEEGRP